MTKSNPSPYIRGGGRQLDNSSLSGFVPLCFHDLLDACRGGGRGVDWINSVFFVYSQLQETVKKGPGRTSSSRRGHLLVSYLPCMTSPPTSQASGRKWRSTFYGHWRLLGRISIVTVFAGARAIKILTNPRFAFFPLLLPALYLPNE